MPGNNRKQNRKTDLAKSGAESFRPSKPAKEQRLVDVRKGDAVIASFPVSGTHKPLAAAPEAIVKQEIKVLYRDGGADVYACRSTTVVENRLIRSYEGETKGVYPQDLAQAAVNSYIEEFPDALDQLVAGFKKPTISTSAFSGPRPSGLPRKPTTARLEPVKNAWSGLH